MSIEAINAMEAHVANRDKAVTVAEIKKRIADFVEWREERQRLGYQNTLVRPRQFHGNQWYRHGSVIYTPEKVG